MGHNLEPNTLFKGLEHGLNPMVSQGEQDSQSASAGTTMGLLFTSTHPRGHRDLYWGSSSSFFSQNCNSIRTMDANKLFTKEPRGPQGWSLTFAADEHRCQLEHGLCVVLRIADV